MSNYAKKRYYALIQEGCVPGRVVESPYWESWVVQPGRGKKVYMYKEKLGANPHKQGGKPEVYWELI